MKYIELKTALKDFIVFSVRDIKKLDNDFHSQRLSEWQKKNYVKKISKNLYIFSDINTNEEVLFLIANKLYGPSYVSLEMALNFYNLIPEGVYSITSISTKKTGGFETEIGNFYYHNVKPKLFFGYRLAKVEDQNYKIAEIEKAVLDYLYFHPEMESEAAFSEWRFNVDEFRRKADMEKFNSYLAICESSSLEKRARKFLKYLENNNAHPKSN